MEAIVQSQQHLADDSSDRSESSGMSQEYQIRGFESYELVKRLNLSVGERGVHEPGKMKDFRLSVENVGLKQNQEGGHRNLDEVNDNLRELEVSIGKSKELSFEASQIGDSLGYHMDRGSSEGDASLDTASQMSSTKETAGKESFHPRQKYLNSGYERSPKKLNSLVGREPKEYALSKGYNLPLERMKEFNLPLDRMRDCHMTVLPRDRLNGIDLIHENSRMMEEHRGLQNQGRSPQDLESMAYERMRRSQHHLLHQINFTAQNLVGSQINHRQGIVGIQQSQAQSQSQSQQQQQIKSFTIDAILAHRNNQKERHRSLQQQLRKAARQECQEVAVKSANSISGSGGNGTGSGSGKAKRVRTIFTAEQLERLEGAFARQQYMVGPERLYLAHQLRLTEAQVKVWFQNRRIKWRKVNHEQQCLAVNEHRQRCSLPSLEIHEINGEESNENSEKWCANSGVPSLGIGQQDEASSPCSQIRELCELRPSPIVKP